MGSDSLYYSTNTTSENYIVNKRTTWYYIVVVLAAVVVVVVIVTAVLLSSYCLQYFSLSPAAVNISDFLKMFSGVFFLTANQQIFVNLDFVFNTLFF